MTQQYQQPEREFGWDDIIQKDATDSIVLAPGDYVFTVEKVERARYTPGPNSKLSACPMAKVVLRIDTEQGSAFANNNLYLHSSTEGLLSAFFSAIGQKKKGEPLKMNWQSVLGARGAVKIKNRTYNDNTYNDVDKLYPLDPSYYVGKEMPLVVQQLQPQQGLQQQGFQQQVNQQMQPQQNFNQQPTQQSQGNYTPGAF